MSTTSTAVVVGKKRPRSANGSAVPASCEHFLQCIASGRICKTACHLPPNCTLHPQISSRRARIIGWRRHLHRHPELSFQEFNTSKYVANHLRSCPGVQVTELVGKTGVVGVLNCAVLIGDALRETCGGALVPEGPGPCVALRADMDALPIQESHTPYNKTYRSHQDGVMHACGHDGHMAMLMATAQALSQCVQNTITALKKHPQSHAQTLQGALWGCVKFIFQPAEEGYGGAREMIKDGVLEGDKGLGPRVDAIYGIHLWNYLTTGHVVVKQGTLMASSDKFSIKVLGKGGHGAVPEGTKDALVACAHLALQLHTIVARNVSPLDAAVLTLGELSCGGTYNAISEQGYLQGTVRTHCTRTQHMIQRRMTEICSGVEASFGVTVELDYEEGYPCTVNAHQQSVQNTRLATAKVVGTNNIIASKGTMAAEDFSYFLQKVPGCFFFVGSSPHQISASNSSGNDDGGGTGGGGGGGGETKGKEESSAGTDSRNGPVKKVCLERKQNSCCKLDAGGSGGGDGGGIGGDGGITNLSEPAALFPHHKPSFDINEDALMIGASVFMHLIYDAMSL